MIRRKRTARNGRKTSRRVLCDFPVVLVYPDGSKRTIGGMTDEQNPDGSYTRVFHKTIRDEHFLHSPRAIGISTAGIKYLRRNKVDQVLVRHARLGTEYRCSLRTFIERSFTQQRADADIQMFLTLDRWSIKHPILEAETPAPAPQLALFGEVAA